MSSRKCLLAVLLTLLYHALGKTPEPPGAPTAPAGDRTYVLAIGIDRYSSGAVATRASAEAGAGRVSRTFADSGATVETLLGAAATKGAISDALVRIARVVRKQDTLVVCFVGSTADEGESTPGKQLGQTRSSRWLTFDSAVDPATHKFSGLGWGELIDMLALCEAGHQLIIQDAPSNAPPRLVVRERLRGGAPVRAVMFAGRAGAKAAPDTRGGDSFADALVRSIGPHGVDLTGLFESVVKDLREHQVDIGPGADPQVLVDPSSEGRDFTVLSPNFGVSVESVRTVGVLGSIGIPEQPLVSIQLLEIDGKAVGSANRALSANAPFQVDKSRVQIMGELKGRATDLTVTVNSEPANLYQVGDDRIFTAMPYLLFGSNTLRVDVEDSKHRTRKFEFSVENSARGSSTPSGLGRNYALIVDSSNYKDMPNLANPVHDGDELERILRDEFRYTKVDRLKDPTHDQLLAKLYGDLAQRKFDANDQLLIFIAGHGAYRDVGRHGMGYLLCSDTTRKEPYYDNPTAVKFTELRDSIANIPCEHILVLIDACFGGTFSDDIAKLRGEPEQPEADVSEQITRLLENTTRRYFASGGKEYVPDAGDDPNHSPFASRIFQALGRKDRRLLTADDLQTALAAMPRKYPAPKAGKFSNDDAGGNFVFVRPGQEVARPARCSGVARPARCSGVARPARCSGVARPARCSGVARPARCSGVARPARCSGVARPARCSVIVRPARCSGVVRPARCSGVVRPARCSGVARPARCSVVARPARCSVIVRPARCSGKHPYESSRSRATVKSAKRVATGSRHSASRLWLVPALTAGRAPRGRRWIRAHR